MTYVAAYLVFSTAVTAIMCILFSVNERED